MSGSTNGMSSGPWVDVGEVGRLKSELSTHPSKWRNGTSWRGHDASVSIGWGNFRITDR